jgi:hypothetical protein
MAGSNKARVRHVSVISQPLQQSDPAALHLSLGQTEALGHPVSPYQAPGGL